MSAALDLRSKEQKDAELDKRIEALRKKNEALIRRYQEIEEDRRKAEQEGVAVTSGLRRAHRPERRDTGGPGHVLPGPGEKRVVKDKKPSGTPKPRRGSGRSSLGPPGRSTWGDPQDSPWEGAPEQGDRGGGRGRRSRGRGVTSPGLGGDTGPDWKSKEWEERRRQNIEKMNEEMEKIAEYERNQRDGLHEKNPVRNFLDDPRRSGPFQDSDRKEGSRRHVRNWGGADFDKVKAGMEKEKTWQGPGRRSSPKSGVPLDMTLSMTGRERAEYVRWKKEREQIDRERLARHRNPTGTWRREWDAEKSDTMFKEDPGVESVGEEEPKRPLPKPPTFGEFLVPPRGQRRRKSRGRGQEVGTKSYSMHDNRWEESEEPPPEAEKQPVEEAPQDPPPALSPEEDEDQWEDVSEEEEEEEEEDWSEDEGPRSASPPAQRPPKRHHVPPTAVGEVGTPPPSPFSPLGGHQPVSDWGEEMECGDNPLLGPTGPKSRGETSGLSPPELTDPPGGPQTPLDSPPPENLQLKEEEEEEEEEGEEEEEEEPLDKQEEAATENGTQGPFPDTTPGTVEITDFQRDPPAPRCPPVAPSSPHVPPPVTTSTF